MLIEAPAWWEALTLPQATFAGLGLIALAIFLTFDKEP